MSFDKNAAAQAAKAPAYHPLATIPLQSGGQAEIVLLRHGWAAAIAALHTQTLQTMGADEQAYMLDKSAATFAKHLKRAAGNTVIGVLHDGKLVAQSMIVHPTAQKPDNGMTDMQAAPPATASSIMQAVSVNPAYRGQKLMEHMIAHWLPHAAKHNRPHVIAEVHVNNVASWLSFLRAGLALQSIGTDLSDGTMLYNAHGVLQNGTLTATFNHHAAQSCAVSDLKQQKTWMAQGCRAVAYDKAKGHLVFTPAPTSTTKPAP